MKIQLPLELAWEPRGAWQSRPDYHEELNACPKRKEEANYAPDEFFLNK